MDQQTDTASLRWFTLCTESRKINTKLMKHKIGAQLLTQIWLQMIKLLHLSCKNYAKRQR
jgi:hypothetical protein